MSNCDLSKKDLKAALVKPYDFDKLFELKYAIYNGLFDNIKPTGNARNDLASFLFGQGGGKSDDINDPASKWLPPTPDKDGHYYHTVNDITWHLYSNIQLSTILKYTPTADDFYNMTEERRNQIIDFHINKGNISSSCIVNYVATYSIWGSGTSHFMLKRFEEVYGNIDVVIKHRGEYFAFSRMLESYRYVLEQRNQHNWHIYGKGWSSGIAHFHRIFKVYCKS